MVCTLSIVLAIHFTHSPGEKEGFFFHETEGKKGDGGDLDILRALAACLHQNSFKGRGREEEKLEVYAPLLSCKSVGRAEMR